MSEPDPAAPAATDRRTGEGERRRLFRPGGRRKEDLPLRDPDVCPRHPMVKGTLVDSERRQGCYVRRHACPTPGCAERWNSFQTLIDPYRIEFRRRT